MFYKVLLPISWLTALCIVFILSGALSDKSSHFYGIAGEREQVISFQYPVEIAKVFVSDGKNVQQGEPMLELKRPQLNNDLTMLDQEIKRYQLQKQETENTLNSQLLSLTAKRQASIAEMDHQIHALQLRLKINSDLMNSISGIQDQQQDTVGNAEIGDLKRQRHFLVEEIQAEIDHVTTQINAARRPVDARLDELVYRKQELQRQNVGLKVSALFDGRIASVNYKAGELVSPFQAIMSVQSRAPRYFKAYIHENIVNDVGVGQTVWVQSIVLNNDKSPLQGIVESMGNRIVEYPSRLKKNPLFPAWGRELVICLNESEYTLLFGEKVKVSLDRPQSDFNKMKIFKEVSVTKQDRLTQSNVLAIQSSNKKIQAEGIEASGLLWLADRKQYLLINDEKNKKQSGIYWFNQGRILDVLSLKDKKKLRIDDLESISTDGEYIYTLSSLSHNRDDKLKAKRKKLIRFKLSGQQIGSWQEVDLYKVLETIKDQDIESDLALFLNESFAEHSLDIESHFVVDNTLYLGFKAPFIEHNKTLIIKLVGVKALFSGQQPVAEVWKKNALYDPVVGKQTRLSDMMLVEGQLFLLSVVQQSSARDSMLWHYQNENQTAKVLQVFADLKAEGLAYRPDESMFTVVFDQGSQKVSKYLTQEYSDLNIN